MKKELKNQKKLKIAIEALKQCVNPAGAYNEDRLIHAENCIKETGRIAKIALFKIGVDISNIKIEQ
jgi:hypothetical protein